MQEPMPDNPDEFHLGLAIGLALRGAREQRGYSRKRMDFELSCALIAEAVQRLAIQTGARPSAEMPCREETYTAFLALMEGVKREARTALGIAEN